MSMEYDLARARPERSKKRKLIAKNLCQHTIRLAKTDKKAIEAEASELGISANMYISIILSFRDFKKISQIVSSSK